MEDKDLSDIEFQRKYGCSRSDVRKLEDSRLQEANALAFGAFKRGGYITVEEEKAAKFLEKKEVRELRDVLVKMSFEHN